jgi:hypothetical protein
MRDSSASSIMARTTLDLDPVITRELRERAERERKSMGQVASEALARAFAADPAEQPPFRWISHHMGETLVDLEDKEALYRVLDEEG